MLSIKLKTSRMNKKIISILKNLKSKNYLKKKKMPSTGKILLKTLMKRIHYLKSLMKWRMMLIMTVSSIEDIFFYLMALI
jgi:hypothetical protein